MPPPRRHPAQPATRRPRVAGTRNRSGAPEPGEQRAESPEDTQVSPPSTVRYPGFEVPASTRPEPEPVAEDEAPTEPEQAPAADFLVEPSSLDVSEAESEPAGDEPAAAAAEQQEEQAAEPAAKAMPNLVLPVVLAVVFLLLVGVGTWFLVQTRQLTEDGPGANHALVDTGATSEVTAQVSRAMETVSSYKYTDLDAAQKAGQAVTTGKFQGEFNQLFTQVKAQAPAQKAVVTGQVAKSAVRMLAGDNAILLVFLNQTTTRADNNQTTTIGLVYTVNAQRLDGKWKISDLTPR
ncbi:hypothetical protein GCM10010174_08020 [Kutzneria viridogrisea]|uniref:Mce-associated membrane protein n=2 Tax=Kutzneria TaxID=43356 RepID=W5WLF0_9PSEU|nr:hypothetical protein [Kutzneria albida]AHI01596.1 hypothetical protein KALB_8238 [Kutzneria albida DSM 43870]MBA8931560.1 Mce-associated membrane protein [Kutzneria viridogrisea]